MADVTEVIHKITYEVDDAELQNVTKTLQLQVNELNNLGRILQGYQKQLLAINNTEVDALNELSGKIEQVSKRIEAKAGQARTALQKIGTGLLEGLGGADIEKAAGKFIEPLIVKLGKLKKITQKSISDVVGTLFSFTNAAPLAISLIADIATQLIEMANAGDEAKEALNEYRKSIQDIETDARKSGYKEIVELKMLEAAATNAGNAMDIRRSAAQKMQDLYPSLLANYSQEAILNGQAAEAIREVTVALLARANAKAAEKKVEAASDRAYELLQKEEKAVKDLAKARKAVADYEKRSPQSSGGSGFMTSVGVIMNSPNPYYQQLKIAADNAKEYRDEISQQLDAARVDQYNWSQDQLRYENEARKRLGNGKVTTGVSRPKLRNEGISVKLNLNTDYKGDETPDELKQRQVDIESEESRRLAMETQIAKEREKNAEKQKEDEIEAKARRKANTLDAISDYQTLAQSVADAYNTIVQVQISALDKEIAIREKRVEAAQKLAERGNVEALRMEEERLRQAQNMREQFARRQQIVNSAITVSNAIAAVARAALEGGGFGSAATIAALIAALAAGYAAVSSMSSDAFADGVVDYKGKGGPRDDANWVRISSGESVITADGTKANRHLLEAINSGAQFKLMNPALPYTMPMFRSPDGSGVYASAQDLGALEGKLDNVVNAIEDNRLRQNIYFNEYGVGIMTEKAIKKDRRRWM